LAKTSTTSTTTHIDSKKGKVTGTNLFLSRETFVQPISLLLRVCMCVMCVCGVLSSLTFGFKMHLHSLSIPVNIKVLERVFSITNVGQQKATAREEHFHIFECLLMTT